MKKKIIVCEHRQMAREDYSDRYSIVLEYWSKPAGISNLDESVEEILT